MYGRYRKLCGQGKGSRKGKLSVKRFGRSNSESTKPEEAASFPNLLPKASHQDEDEEKYWWMDRFFNYPESEGESEEETVEMPEVCPGAGSNSKPADKPSDNPVDKPVMKPEPSVDTPEQPAMDEPVEKPERPKEEEPVLEPLTLDIKLMAMANKFRHNTNDFCRTIFAVRRGQEFNFEIVVNRKFNPEKDSLVLNFMIGDMPMASKDTLMRLVVLNEAPSQGNPYEWSAYVSSVDALPSGSSRIVVAVKASADCPVGDYKLKVSYFRKEQKKEKRVSKTVDNIYILFNAWCEYDHVFMDSMNGRKEYVLRQTGRIYTGNAYFVGNRAWNFAQFSKATLKTAMLLLERSNLPTKAHGNPTEVARVLSAMVNSNDNDGGVLVGNWSGEYSAGISPTMWIGSQAIFEKYLEDDAGVQFGQCWVFSALVTSLARCLGIPTRSVTNFDSAHDTDGSATIDTHYDIEGKPLDDLNDSVWNFHVWNESWFKRPDLPEGYGGWQAYDATPQEYSEGMMQCGPASVAAIKEGQLHLNHDAKFIYAEVNGIKVTWEVSPKMQYTVTDLDYNSVGTRISTKAVLEDKERLDITEEYKYTTDKTKAEEVRNRALNYMRSYTKLKLLKKEMGLANRPHDVIFGYQSEVKKNGDITISVVAKNNASSVRTIQLDIDTCVGFYTGIRGKRLETYKAEMVLEAGTEQTETFSLKGKDYLNKINDDAMVVAYIAAKAVETKQAFRRKDIFPMEKPDLDMQASSSKPKVGEEIEVSVSFTNPLDIKLTDAFLIVEGPGIQKQRKIMLEKPVDANATLTEKVKVTPKYVGKREFLAAFTSRQLIDITGAVSLEVVE